MSGAEPVHMALFFGSEDEYLDGVVGFLAPGVESGDPIALTLPAARAAMVRERLGEIDSTVEVFDAHELARNPARIIPSVMSLLDRHRGRRVHQVGEPAWPGRSAEEMQEVLRHEALINLAWPGAQLRSLCPYDVSRLPASVIRDAESTHPWVMRGGEVARNDAFAGPQFPQGTDDPLPDPPSDAATFSFGLEHLSAVRALVAQRAAAAGLPAEKRDDLVIAVNEVATNAIKHGPSDGRLRIWSGTGEVICQLEDGGHIADPLAGRHRPVPDGQGGLGLWMVNQLCDLVQTRTTPQGTTIRLRATAA